MNPTLKQYALELLPPFLVRLIRPLHLKLRAQGLITDSLTVISTPDELEAWITRADAAGQNSDDALRSVLESFRYRISVELPHDPFSPAYAAGQWNLYRQVSGRPGYIAEQNEQSSFDFDALVQRPFPYSTLSCETVGNHLVMQGMVIEHLGLHPHSEVLEFGPGSGGLTLQLAMMGHQVTAVEISPHFTELIRRRAQQLGLAVTPVCDNMLRFESGKAYDAVVFFESFHHCAEHFEMLKRLHRFVKEDGVVVFGFEPIAPTAEFWWGSYPWGIRLDGMSVWSMRKFGWLELGFTDGYFLKALNRSGWQGTLTRFDTRGWTPIVVARKR